jgi:hypothetical protein
MLVASQATEGATKMKSHTLPGLRVRVMPATQVQISLPVQDDPRRAQHQSALLRVRLEGLDADLVVGQQAQGLRISAVADGKHHHLAVHCAAS